MEETTMNDVTPAVSKEEQNWAMLCHLSALIGFVIPFGSILGPLVIWLIKRADMPLVDQHGKEALNFQLTVAILALISWALVVVLIGFVLLAVVALGALFFVIRAAIKISNGELGYRYPYSIRFLK
jgi:uncharacterized Tic20 family protein